MVVTVVVIDGVAVVVVRAFIPFTVVVVVVVAVFLLALFASAVVVTKGVDWHGCGCRTRRRNNEAVSMDGMLGFMVVIRR